MCRIIYPFPNPNAGFTSLCHQKRPMDIYPGRTLSPWASYQIRKIAGAHAPGMPGTFSPSLQASDPDMHHGACVTHVPWCKPGSLTSGFFWNRRRGNTFPAFPSMRNLQYYVSGKRPMRWHIRQTIVINSTETHHSLVAHTCVNELNTHSFRYHQTANLKSYCSVEGY